jgi:hypothetical protein
MKEGKGFVSLNSGEREPMTWSTILRPASCHGHEWPGRFLALPSLATPPLMAIHCKGLPDSWLKVLKPESWQPNHDGRQALVMVSIMSGAEPTSQPFNELDLYPTGRRSPQAVAGP